MTFYRFSNQSQSSLTVAGPWPTVIVRVGKAFQVSRHELTEYFAPICEVLATVNHGFLPRFRQYLDFPCGRQANERPQPNPECCWDKGAGAATLQLLQWPRVPSKQVTGMCVANCSLEKRERALNSRKYLDMLLTSGKFREVVMLLDCCRMRM